jgi:polysaccharide deacetylase
VTPAIVTTSWDDGHPSDVRLAELLASYGVAGTFYVPLRYEAFPALTHGQLRAIGDMGMEIGSHTVTHPVLTTLSDAAIRREVFDSKRMLEDIVGRPVSSFSYPCGRFDRRVRAIVAEAGYTLARTTVAFRTGLAFNCLAMPVSFQFASHGRLIGLRHALKEGNLAGLFNWLRLGRMERDLLALSDMLAEHVRRDGGVMHVWGHSWELDRLGLWSVLDQVLRRIARQPGACYATNGQVRTHLSPAL